MQRAAVATLAQQLTHFREFCLRFVAEREERLGATKFFALSGYFQYLVGRHGMRPGLAGIATIGAVRAVVAAQIRERDEYFARVGDDARAVLFFQMIGRRQQLILYFQTALQES